ncbi:MAG: hypothetical protein A3G41_04670 [Elusimicrobia bacterium RIFCSPLOWO2_12_FULL_59_9]|nr:MAG: hypothetical protein A3G41_04670 [Elusimicrobia bacterium RIFCSPLOWO2_12_FULL_59_9]
MLRVDQLPHLNAALNLTSAFLLIAGYLCIRSRNTRAHAACMLSAFAVSIAFLTSYLIYHARAGSVAFRGAGGLRLLYFSILIPHVVLAAAILPLALRTLVLALRGRFEKHRALARWTLPIWLYVSVSGVAVYGMLYWMGG